MSYCFSLDTEYDVIKAAVGDAAGTYRLCAWHEKLDGIFRKIGRVVGCDEKGTLYIGTSQNIVSRTDMLKHAIRTAYNCTNANRSKFHTCARGIGRQFQQFYPYDRLCIELSPMQSDMQGGHYEEEWRLLMGYFESFGEFPPLNGIKPSRTGKPEPATTDSWGA